MRVAIVPTVMKHITMFIRNEAASTSMIPKNALQPRICTQKKRGTLILFRVIWRRMSMWTCCDNRLVNLFDSVDC